MELRAEMEPITQVPEEEVAVVVAADQIVAEEMGQTAERVDLGV
jgi:hypothetical protein